MDSLGLLFPSETSTPKRFYIHTHSHSAQCLQHTGRAQAFCGRLKQAVLTRRKDRGSGLLG